MGSASSKAVRKLPKEKPAWAGSRAPTVAATEPERSRPEKPLAFESKHELTDSKDPHFMGKLNQLGPVRVDHHVRTAARAANFADVQNMYQSRIRSEVEADAAASTQSANNSNRLLASSLTELLDARKLITNGAELEALAKRYHIDVATLDRLGQVVNTPSVDESTVLRTVDKHGEESLTMVAHWVDPVSHSRA